ncbi:MAG: amidohydrolase family protein [Alphaproteobacteria bacterium]|nr:amidohydrolase family protein [Alphaproteobacteria bacterium]
MRIQLFLLVGIISATTALAPASAETRRYDWLTIGEKSGALIVEDGADGALSYSFSFNDRGRGPEITARYRLNSDGVPVEISIEGKNYRKGDAAETFSIENGVARWSTATGGGERRLAAPALYRLQGASSPEHAAILARALLADADGRMATLPAGELRIEEIETQAFEGPGGATDATLYALYAASPYPDYIWLDEDKNLFGADYGWFAIAPEGMASAMPAMKARQDAATDDKTAELSDAFAHDASGLVVIRNAKLFDSIEGEVAPRATVFLQDGVISAVYDRSVAAPDGAMAIDAKGKTLMPALWDMHAHVGTDNLFNYLSASVLSIRDMANDPDYIVKLRRKTAAGEFAAPDVYPMGFIDRRSPFAAPTGMLADDLGEALSFVDWYAQRGFLGIKLYSSIDPAWVAPIAEAAHARGMSVLGHIPSGMTAEEAIRAGYDEITHINMVFLNFVDGAKEIDTRTPQRFIVPTREGGELDVEGPAFRALLDLMKEKGVAHDPTFTIFQEMFLNVPGETSMDAVRFRDNLPEAERAGLIATEGFNKGLEAEGRATSAVAKKIVTKLHEEGIPILPGTDSAYPGFVLLRELELLGEAGIPATDVLQLATIGAARRMQVDQSLGSVTPGKKAYLILVDGDPTERLADLLKVDTAIKGTAMFRPAEIHEAFGIRPF